MRPRALARTLAVLAVGALAVTAFGSARVSHAPVSTPTAVSFAGVSTVGPLFRGPVSGAHVCTASVVDSPSQDLILTAAHCITGNAAGLSFAPGYDDGATPYGVWRITAAFVDPHWSDDQDPEYDYALLRVARQERGGHDTSIERVTGGNPVGQAAASGTQITDVAYNGGVGGQAIRCTVAVYYTDAFPGFDCHGHVGGSSGSPWFRSVKGVDRPMVVGVIGGLHQGGCTEYTSYSPPFGTGIVELLRRAATAATSDDVPAPDDDGC